MERLICLGIGYICGLFQTSYIYGKMHQIDIREHGSGNAGTTNALRTMGKKAGALTLLGDCVKCLLAVFVARILYGNSHQELMPLLTIYAAFGCILGHNFPFYLNFRGGKGIAASVGMLLAVDWRIFLVCAAVFFLLFFIAHYVSLCSISAYVTAFVMVVIFGMQGRYGLTGARQREMDILMFLMMVLALWRHKDNIIRLRNGTENRLYFNKMDKDKQKEK